MQNDKYLNIVNLQFIVMGVLGIPMLLIGVLGTLALASWGPVKFDLFAKLFLGFLFLIPLFFIAMPYFLTRNHKWAYWSGIFILLFSSLYSLYQFLFYLTGIGLAYLTNSPFSSGTSLVFIIWSYFSIRTLHRIKKSLV
jgi:hypothetical protein